MILILHVFAATLGLVVQPVAASDSGEPAAVESRVSEAIDDVLPFVSKFIEWEELRRPEIRFVSGDAAEEILFADLRALDPSIPSHEQAIRDPDARTRWMSLQLEVMARVSQLPLRYSMSERAIIVNDGVLRAFEESAVAREVDADLFLRSAMAHEVTHAAQDQRFGLMRIAQGVVERAPQSRLKAYGNAFVAMTEGHALLVQVAATDDIAGEGSGDKIINMLGLNERAQTEQARLYGEGHAICRAVFQRDGMEGVWKWVGKPPPSVRSVRAIYDMAPSEPVFRRVPTTIGQGWRHQHQRTRASQAIGMFAVVAGPELLSVLGRVDRDAWRVDCRPPGHDPAADAPVKIVVFTAPDDQANEDLHGALVAGKERLIEMLGQGQALTERLELDGQSEWSALRIDPNDDSGRPVMVFALSTYSRASAYMLIIGTETPIHPALDAGTLAAELVTEWLGHNGSDG